MITIIAGSRSITKYFVVKSAMELVPWTITEVVSGTAPGVDRLGERWAREHKIPVKRMPAQWDQHGKSAGYRRNEDMAKYAKALVAIHDGESRGTKHMITIARQYNLEVMVFLFKGTEDASISQLFERTTVEPKST